VKVVKTKKKVIIILTTLFLVLVIVSWVLDKNPALLDADYAFRTVGYSMFPAQRPNDLVLVREGIEGIQIGNVICFRKWCESDYYLVGHRVMEIQIYPYLAFKTKGDFNKFSDGWISEKDIVGREILNIPFGFLLAKNSIFFLAGLIVILVLVF
jgi:signal peptidase I